MRKLLTPLKSRIPLLTLIITFLLIQAYCDLTLPQYTANIVDIGIQNTDFDYIINIGSMMLVMVAISALATVGVSFFQANCLQDMLRI